MQTATFLTAEWRNLLMLNYVVDPRVLHPLVPPGTELDFYNGQTYLSVVGFQFARTKVLGVSIPFHTDFEEVNLRFYVRYKAEKEWRRGVVFIRELVPRRAIATIARVFYGEPYLALPMRHSIERSSHSMKVEYAWKRSRWESMSARTTGELGAIADGSEEEFITEHYWGYTARGARTCEYQVEHPRWRVSLVNQVKLDADISTLYGEQFVPSLKVPPTSAFLAEGSPITVRRGRLLTG